MRGKNRNLGSEHYEFIQQYKQKRAEELAKKKAKIKDLAKTNPQKWAKMVNKLNGRKEKKKKSKNKNTGYNWSDFVRTTCKFRDFVYLERFETSPKERQIENILNFIDVTFYREVTFGKNKRFDFYLTDYDIVIEYDGKQHFKSEDAINNDKVKNGILENAGIKYFRYNYSHKDLKSQIIKDLGITVI